jgi:hypothetical protein
MIIIASLAWLGMGCTTTVPPPTKAALIRMEEVQPEAGYTAQLIIEPSGLVTFRGKPGVPAVQQTISPAEMAEVVDLFYQENFFALRDAYRGSTGINAGPLVAIQYEDTQRKKRVEIYPGASTPAAFATIRARLRSYYPTQP